MFPYLSAGLRLLPPRPLPTGQSVVFGKPLKESLKYASVQISTANGNGELYVWGYIPVVVAKSCVPFTLRSAIVPANANKLRNPRGLYLKEQGAFYPHYARTHPNSRHFHFSCCLIERMSDIPRMKLYSNRDRGNVSNKWE